MFGRYDIKQMEMDFCDKVLGGCIDKGLELMNVNLSWPLYKIWESYAKNSLKDVAEKINDPLLVKNFNDNLAAHYKHPWEQMSRAINFLIHARSEAARKFIFNYNSDAPSTQPDFLYRNSEYINPYIQPNQQDIQLFQPREAISQYASSYNTIQSVLSRNQMPVQQENEALILSIINTTNNQYNSSSLNNLPIGVVKALSDASIEFLAAKIKEEYNKNENAANSIIIYGLKELAKQKMHQIIDQWYTNRFRC